MIGAVFGKKKEKKSTSAKPAAARKTGAQDKGPTRKRRRRTGRGALWVIAMMLATSGLLRFGGETGRAIASELTATGHDATPTEAHSTETPEDVAAVLELLREREARIAVREAAIEDRMQALAIAEDQVSRNLAELERVEAELKGTMALASTAAENDLARLTTVYENMKPKDAAPVFAAMDPQFAAGFLGRMRPDAAAAIMAGLEPEAAYTISVLLAGRNARVPTE